MREPRRMRRFEASNGAQYDEIPCGLLRLRLEHGDPRPIPRPQTMSAVVCEIEKLREMTTTELTMKKRWARR